MTDSTQATEDDTWPNWALDVTSLERGGPPVFCPIEDYGTIVIGMNLMGRLGRGRRLIAVFHEDGQDACDKWFETHKDEFIALQAEYNV